MTPVLENILIITFAERRNVDKGGLYETMKTNENHENNTQTRSCDHFVTDAGACMQSPQCFLFQ